MTRSAALSSAVRALDDHRRSRSQHPPDLFSAIESVAEHEGDEWRRRALAALETAARSRSELTIEDVAWPAAIDNRARGSVLLEGARLGWIKKLGYVNGGAERHGRPVRLWASRLYRGGDGA